jgi:uncharacterized membrane protein YfcA
MAAETEVLSGWGVLAIVLAVFFIGGAVKGAAGLGLPPIAMGLLVLVMPPASAAAIMVIPVMLANVWQALRGPALGALLRRFWPVFGCLAVTTVLLSGWLVESTGALGVIAIGGMLVLYAALALSGLTLRLKPDAEPVLGPVVGLTTGALTAATGIAAIPLLPYLQSVGLSRDRFVQSLGLAFSISSLALGVGLSPHMATMPQWPALLSAALVGLALGMALGELLRRRLRESAFRRIVLWLLLALGMTLVLSQV